MITKLLEIRDRGTRIPALAIKVDGQEDGPIMRGAGFQGTYVLLASLAGGKDMRLEWDPLQWATMGRTLKVAHAFIEREFDRLAPNAVVDVRVILHEADQPAPAEFVV